MANHKSGALSSTLSMALYFFRAYSVRSLVMWLSLLASGLAEGVGAMSVLPVIMSVQNNTGGDSNMLLDTFWKTLSVLGLAPTLGNLLCVLVAGFFLKSVLVLLAMQQVGYTVAHVTSDLRLNLIRGLMKAKWPYFISQPSGMFSNSLATEADRAALSYLCLCRMIAFVIQVTVYFVLALMVSWKVSLAGILIGSLIIMVFGGLVKKARLAGESQTKYIKALICRMTDALQGIKPLKAMGCEDRMTPLIEEEVSNINDALRNQVVAREALNAFQEPLIIMVMAIGLFVMVSHFSIPLAGQMTLAFLFYRMITKFVVLQNQYQAMVMNQSAFWSLMNSVSAARAEKEDGFGTDEDVSFARSLELRDVCFSHGSRDILDKANLEIPAQGVSVLTGPTGVGKSTTVDLLTGLLRPQQGDVYLDGKPLATIDIHRWRQMIGYVPQEMFLFHDSILNNISLGEVSIATDDIWAALRIAEADDFVRSMPDGIDSIVGERGAKLSGGQRQRLAIARAVVRKPRLLILDEPTTALDKATEAEICQTIKRLSQDMAVVSISHQEGVLRDADHIWELQHAGFVRRR